MKARSKLNAIDLFAGAGGFSLAARQAGVNIVFAVENEKWSAETYRKNLCRKVAGNKPILYQEDIRKLVPEDLKSKHFDSKDCDIVLGGPPCQGFSSHRLYDNTVTDRRNKLIHQYFSFVKVLRPSLFLMENVPGMLWDRHKRHLDAFYRNGKRAHYNLLPPIVLDARDYGVPQRRKRVFILGVRKDLGLDLSAISWPPPPTHGSAKAIERNPRLSLWEACASAFAPPRSKDDPNDVRMKHTKALTDVFASTPKRGGRLDSNRMLRCHKNHVGHKDVYGRIDSRLPAPTMTTACFNPSKGRFVHPTRNHGITIRQAARIQTFPEKFKFSGGLTASGVQVGNAVPIRLGKVLIKHLAGYLVK